MRHRMLAAAMVLAAAAHAQEIRATLSGITSDQTGAVIPGAQIAAVNTATNLRLTTITGADGRFVLPQLAPGPYELTAEANGFRKYTRRGINLNVGDKANIDIQMEIGALADAVTVTAELTGIESDQSVMGQLMGDRQVAELPLNGRSFLMLIQLSAGTTFTAKVGVGGWSGTRQFETGPESGPFTIHGGRPGTNAFLLDGAPLGIEGGTSFTPLPDAIEEFKVVAPTSDASQGLAGGGVVSVRMKSGTNELHGIASEFLRNGIFDAASTQTNRAAAQRPDLKGQQQKWNNFSGMVSGPIIKNKFFGVVNYDGFRQREPNPLTVTVPTELQREGDYSRTLNAQGQQVVVYDPLTTRQSGSTYIRDPFANNRLPASRTPPVARNLMSYIPLPNIVTEPVTNLNNYAATPNMGRYRYDSYYAKLDYLWSENHRTFFSGTQNWGHAYRSTNGIPNGNPTAVGPDPRIRDHMAATVDHTYVMTARTVLTTRLAFDRWEESWGVESLDNFDGSTLGFKGPIGSDPTTRFPRLTFTDYLNLANVNPFFSPNEVYTAVADVSWTLGRHQVKFGTRAGQARYSDHAAGQLYGQFGFTKGYTQRDPQRADATSGHAIAAFLLGYPNAGGTDTNPYSTYENKFAGLYFQDDFKVTPKLTLNLGVRWDVQTAPTERYDRMVRAFDPQVRYQLGPSQATGGFLFADSGNRRPWSTNWLDFQPRLGAAFQASRKLILRGGYGLSYVPLNGAGGAGGIQQNGYSRRTPLVATIGGGLNAFIPAMPGTGTLELPFPDGILEPMGSAMGPKTQVGQGIAYLNNDYVIPRVHQFHAGFSYELPWKMTADAAFVGSRTRKFRVSRELNFIPLEERLKGVADPNYLNASVPNPYAGAPELAGTGLSAATITRAQSLRPYPQFTAVTDNGLSTGATSYNALEFKLNKRFSQGVLITAAYTFAKVIEEIAYREDQYTALERVLASFDRAQHLTVNALYELPFGRGRMVGNQWSPGMDALLGGWQFNVIFEAMSGTPTAMPDATPLMDPRLPEGQQSRSKWFKTCTQLTSGARANCASASDPVVWLQLKPNELRTFSSRFPNLRDHQLPQMNASVFKTFRLSERFRLEFRAEAFNAFNTPIYGSPATGITSANFGQVVADQWNFPRSLQLALRLKF
jgi:hypothetical protein